MKKRKRLVLGFISLVFSVLFSLSLFTYRLKIEFMHSVNKLQLNLLSLRSCYDKTDNIDDDQEVTNRRHLDNVYFGNLSEI